MKSVYLLPLLLSFNVYAECVDNSNQEITKKVVMMQVHRTQVDGKLILKHQEKVNKVIGDDLNLTLPEECEEKVIMESVELNKDENLEKNIEAIMKIEPLVLNYEFDKYHLTKNHIELINRFIYQSELGSIVIEGHADSQGEEDYNNTLSYKRALTVKNYIKDKFGDEYAIRVVAFGEEQPECSVKENKLTGCNRRVNIYLSSQVF